jgi:hypothetical protein
MLVTLATNQTVAASSSQTYTYSPNSLQKVFINVEDTDWINCKVTVQVGSTTILNGVQMWGLSGLSNLQSSTTFNASEANGYACIDFGNHILSGNDNLYVTIDAVGALATSVVDVSAIVNSPGKSNPLRLTEYSDNTFTSANNLFAICWDNNHAVIDEDSYNCEIRTSVDSSAPSFISASSFYKSVCQGIGSQNYFGILNDHAVPLHTTYNYNSSAISDRILTVEKMMTTRVQVAQARQSIRRTVSLAGK